MAVTLRCLLGLHRFGPWRRALDHFHVRTCHRCYRSQCRLLGVGAVPDQSPRIIRTTR